MNWYRYKNQEDDILAKLWLVDKPFNFKLPHDQRLAASAQMPSTFEIWLACPSVRSCNDARPVVVIGTEDRGVKVFPISSSTLYSKPRGDLRVSQRDFPADFQSAGLRSDSYIINETTQVEPSRFRKRLGALTGHLLREFRDWFGL